MIAFILNTVIDKFIETEGRLEVTRGWKGRENGKLLLNSYKVSVQCDKKFWKQMIVMVAQHCKYNCVELRM